MPKKTTLAPEAGLLSAYDEWVSKATHGDILVYWKGDLQFDRDPANLGIAKEDRQRLALALDAAAKAIIRDAEAKRIYLFQHRVEKNVFEYRAIRNRPKLDPENAPRDRHGIPLPA